MDFDVEKILHLKVKQCETYSERYRKISRYVPPNYEIVFYNILIVV